MKIAFTICSNNYLSLARTLGRSLFQTNNDYHFIIGLADKLNDGLKEHYKGFEVLPCDQIGIPFLQEISLRYNITEFNTALKPFYYHFFFNKYPDAEYITFLDPDMLVYRRLTELEEGHRQYDIILTPHILDPQVFDGKLPNEISYLSTGTFNLGFLSLRKSDNTQRMLLWWAKRLRHFCYFDFHKGLFVDQKWMNLVSVFFESVYILKHYGYNVAYWNLPERKLSIENGVWTINNTYPLTIYHFSSVAIREGKLFDKYQNRFVDEDLPLNKNIFNEYRSLVLAEGYLQTNTCKCYYIEMRNKHITLKMKRTLGGRIKLLFKKCTASFTRILNL